MRTGKPFLQRSFLLLTWIIALAACSDGSDKLPRPDYAPEMLGPFAVGHSAFTAVDVERGNRMLAVEVWYPVDPEDRQDSPRTSYPLSARR